MFPWLTCGFVPHCYSLFEKCPSTKALFGFFPVKNGNDADVRTSDRFMKHARYMIQVCPQILLRLLKGKLAYSQSLVFYNQMQMLDKALNMLGPDAEILSEILTDRKFDTESSLRLLAMAQSSFHLRNLLLPHY